MATVRQRLAAVDEANIVLDHVGQVNVFLIACVLSPGGFLDADGTPDMVTLRATLRERIAALPALRRAVTGVGRRHGWIDLAPDLEHHIRLVDPVDGLTGLQHTCAQLMNQPLPPDRPLWEILVAPGAAADGVGIVLRIHHAVADGMAAIAIVQRLLDHRHSPETPLHVSPPPRAPHRGPRAAWRQVRLGLHRIRKTVRSHDVGPTVLLGERTESRGVVFVEAEVAALAAAARSHGATVNDALLAAIASGFRAALAAAGESIPDHLPVSVPVALPRDGTVGNRVGVMLVQLPLGELAPDERRTRIAAQTREEKVRARDQGTFELMRGPTGARIMDRLARHQRLVAGFVTNVPGPEGTLVLAGAPIAAMWPVAVLAGNVRLGVAAISYNGKLCCGVHFDAAHVPGDAFAAAMADELTRLSSGPG